MSSFGVLPEGFRLKTLDDILAELEAAEREAFGQGINTQADSVLGHLNGIFGDQIAQAWEVAQAVLASLYPDSASGAQLENVGAITGALKLAAAPSTVTLYVNIDAGVTIDAGKIVGIGANGEQWETTEDVTNGGADPVVTSVEAESSNEGPIAGNASAIDTIITPVSGWTAKAALLQNNTEPFLLVNNQTLIIEVDEGSPQTVTFLTADFVSIGAALATEVATKINSATTGITATAIAGQVFVESDTDGEGSAIEITGGTANAALGFSHDLWKGLNPSFGAVIDSGVVGPYTLSNGETLTVKVDGGGVQTFTFLTANFVSIAAATAREIAIKINTTITGAKAMSANGFLRIQSLTRGTNSTVEVTGGTANVALEFEEDTETGGTSGDATLGRDDETDAEFRLRREQLLRISGAATLEAIRSAVRGVDDVLQAFVFENTTDAVDGNGLPAHSFEVVVSGGTDADVAAEIFAVKPVGIATYRDPGAAGRTVTVTDSQGFTHDINFTRPTEVEIYIAIEVEIDTTAFGGGDEAAGMAQVQDALKELGDSLAIGEDVIINRFLSAAFDVTGVTDVTDIKIDDVDPPVGTVNFAVAARELARFSTARIEVTIA